MRIIIVIFTLFLSQISNGQRDGSRSNLFRIGIGTRFLGSGDLLLPHAEFEYQIKFKDWLYTGVSLNFGHLNYTTGAFPNSRQKYITTSLHSDQYVYFTLAKTSWMKLIIGVGTSLMYVNDVYGSVYEDVDNRYSIEELSSSTRFSVGGQVSPEMNIKLSRQLQFYIRGVIQPYFNSDISSGISLGILLALSK